MANSLYAFAPDKYFLLPLTVSNVFCFYYF
ncbi:hypothetical protein MXB_1520 [Myxobolus squamalis]|nr:hypothetical protein MXB_1520 [Myxobolus squamalis]